MSDNEAKLPGKSFQIVLTIVFVAAALVLVMIVKPFGTVHVPDKAPGAAAPGSAPAVAPPAKTPPPAK